MGRNPFSMVVGSQETPADDPQWLEVAQTRTAWEFGDEISYEGLYLRIRDVNKKMAQYIFQHFDDGKSMKQRRV
jgi:hypothetical protein